MNVGASAPEQAGLYFSWGNTQGHRPGDGYEFTEAAYNNTPGVEISGNIPISQDAARVNMGGSWRIPTKEEFDELFNSLYTTNEWVDNYKGSGVNGCLVTSKANGNKLFFPAAGLIEEEVRDLNSDGNYWSNSFSDSENAYYMYSASDDLIPYDSGLRFMGYTVRAVQS